MGLRILDSRPGARLAALEGEMNIYTVAALKDDMARALAGGREMEVDLAGVGEIDTAGLQLMLMSKRLAGTSLRFINHSPAVLRMLELSNLASAIGDPLVLVSPRHTPPPEDMP